MSIKQNNKSEGQNMERLKEIPKWTRRYTENRTLPFVINMMIFLLFCSAIGIPSYFGGKAYRSGNVLQLWICILSLMIVIPLLIFCSVPKWGGKFNDKLIRFLYRKEGQVTLAIPKRTKKQQRIGMIAGWLFGVCIVISVILGVLGYIPIKYMQPVSAIYVVPFIIAIGIWQRPSVNPAGFLAWLWPTLYTIHAILVVAGVPIQFDRPWIFLNMLIPIAGYGILCGLIGHIYSRYVLKNLKAMTHLQENTDEQRT